MRERVNNRKREQEKERIREIEMIERENKRKRGHEKQKIRDMENKRKRG